MVQIGSADPISTRFRPDFGRSDSMRFCVQNREVRGRRDLRTPPTHRRMPAKTRSASRLVQIGSADPMWSRFRIRWFQLQPAPVQCYPDPLQCYTSIVQCYPEPLQCYPNLVQCYTDCHPSRTMLPGNSSHAAAPLKFCGCAAGNNIILSEGSFAIWDGLAHGCLQNSVGPAILALRKPCAPDPISTRFA